MTKRVRFEIECGPRLTVDGNTPQEAWLSFVAQVGDVFLPKMARFREIPWNKEYSWDKGIGNDRLGRFYFVERTWFARDQALPAEAIAS